METTASTQLDSTITWIALGKDLINCLKTKGNHRLSRYDAFMWIIENIQKGQLSYGTSGRMNTRPEYRVHSLERLAQEWNWSKPTVRDFLHELVNLSAITLHKEGNTLIFSVGKSSCANLVL